MSCTTTLQQGGCYFFGNSTSSLVFQCFVDKIKTQSRLYLAEYYTVISYFARSCQIFLTTQATECQWETYTNIFKHAPWHINSLEKNVYIWAHTCSYKQSYTHAHGLILRLLLCVSFEQKVERDGGIDRRDDWPCCFPPVIGKCDCTRGKRWRRGGKVFLTVPRSPLTRQLSVLQFQFSCATCVCVCVCFL